MFPLLIPLYYIVVLLYFTTSSFDLLTFSFLLLTSILRQTGFGDVGILPDIRVDCITSLWCDLLSSIRVLSHHESQDILI